MKIEVSIDTKRFFLIISTTAVIANTTELTALENHVEIL